MNNNNNNNNDNNNNNNIDRKSIFKSKIEEIKEILYGPILNRDEKEKEIKKILYDPRNNIFPPEKDHYKPVKIESAFSNNYTEYKYNWDKNKTLLFKDYLDKIKPYLSDITNYHKTQGEWKIHLTMVINFFTSKDFEETRTTYSKSDNIEVIMGNETDEIIEDLLILFYEDTNKKKINKRISERKWVCFWFCWFIVL